MATVWCKVTWCKYNLYREYYGESACQQERVDISETFECESYEPKEDS